MPWSAPAYGSWPWVSPRRWLGLGLRTHTRSSPALRAVPSLLGGQASGRRDFLRVGGSLAMSLGFGRSAAIRRGLAHHLTILHTADIHAQIDQHDEFFWEDGRAVFKKRGGFATLRTMIKAIRS